MADPCGCTITMSCQDWLRHGPSIVGVTNVGRVMLSDKWGRFEPQKGALGPDNCVGIAFFFEDGYIYDKGPHTLPAELFDMIGLDADGSRKMSGVTFANERDAEAFLSVACLAWAREQIQAEYVASIGVLNDQQIARVRAAANMATAKQWKIQETMKKAGHTLVSASPEGRASYFTGILTGSRLVAQQDTGPILDDLACGGPGADEPVIVKE